MWLNDALLGQVENVYVRLDLSVEGDLTNPFNNRFVGGVPAFPLCLAEPVDGL